MQEGIKDGWQGARIVWVALVKAARVVRAAEPGRAVKTAVLSMTFCYNVAGANPEPHSLQLRFRINFVCYAFGQPAGLTVYLW